MLKFEQTRRRLHLLCQAFDELLALRLAELFDVLKLAVGVSGNFENFADLFDDGLRYDAVLLVIFLLDLAAAVGFRQRLLHGIRHAVGIHDHHALAVTRGTSDDLDQRARTAQKAFLVRVEDRDQRHLGNIQALAQQVDADQHVKFAETQIAHDLHALHRVYIVVHIAHADARGFEVIGQVLRHFFGERRHEHALLFGGADIDLGHQIVELSLGGTHRDLGVEQAGGSDDLLRHDLTFFQLQVAGRRADEYRLVDVVIEFVKAQRPVVERRRQTKAVIHQTLLACAVAGVHAPDLRQRHVGFVHEQQKIVGKIIEQRVRLGAGRSARENARIVFDAGTKADLLQHFHIIARALLDALGFEQLAVFAEEGEPFVKLALDLRQCDLHFVARNDIVRGRINRRMLQDRL